MAATQELMLGEGAGAPAVYVEDVFSTYLYTGTGVNRTITNNIDTSTKGGLVWIKDRTSASYGHMLYDTARGASNGFLHSNTTEAAYGSTYGLTAFGTTGFDLDGNSEVNLDSSQNYVSWTFRKQPKFFDVVTYTGNGANTTIAHNLGAAPGCIIIKRTDAVSDWYVYHQSNISPNSAYELLNTTGARVNSTTIWNNTAPTSTVFSLGATSLANTNGGTYVAYLWASDAGGFGLAGTDNVVNCGSFSSGSAVTTGFEPQYIMYKKVGAAGTDWYIVDVMRGFSQSYYSYLNPNLANSEQVSSGVNLYPTATGFVPVFNTGAAAFYIYVAIRRGPMKVPTDATKVFKSVLWSGNDAASRNISGIGFVPDVANLVRRNNTGPYFMSGFYDRLRGNPVLATSSTQTESFWAGTAINMGAFGQADLTLPSTATQWNDSPTTFVGEFFQRAPSFCDEVCYTGTGTTTTVTHNLGVAPELMIIKNRGGAQNWTVYTAPTGNTQWMYLNTVNSAQSGTSLWNNTSPTATNFTVINSSFVNGAGSNYVAWLFASCPGVSKVGSYTGTGTLTTINCGFPSGVRFLMIKRTDADSDWFVWDTARGMVAGTDPSFLWDSAVVETNANSAYTVATGFQLLATPSRDVNTNGGTYTYLAIA